MNRNNTEVKVVEPELSKSWASTSIAVKITAVVVWGVMPIAFALTIPLLNSIEEELNKDHLWIMEQVYEHIDNLSVRQSAIKPESLKHELLQFRQKFDFHYLELTINNQRLTIGHHKSEHSAYKVNYSVTIAGKPQVLSIMMEFPSIKRGIELARMKYGSLIVIFTIILGLYLVYVIRSVLHAPFQRIIDATRSVTRGDLDTRLDIQTDDEFGHLSNFFNHMIEELAQKQKSLAHTNQFLERALRNKDMALAESRAKSLFLANMSHEIRTPMTAILGYAESLYQFGAEDQEQMKDGLKTIYRNSKHLVNIINDILDLSKIEADKLQVESIEFSPAKMMQEVEQLMSIQAKEKSIELKFINNYPLPEKICSDPTRLKQVLFNLISNAIRFTEQGCVTVHMKCLFERELLVFSILDQGIGLTPEQIKHIFQPYVQADISTARHYGGTGLGLMIARRLVSLMGGKIKVASSPGKGSLFKFSIQTGSLDNIAQLTQDANIQDIRDEQFNNIPHLEGRVLLVEDIEDNQKLISLYLKQTGLNIDIANNGQEGVDKAAQAQYDLILMDMQMPVMDGLEATRILRQSGYLKPIIALTANVLKNETDIYLQAGCNAILSKPIIINEFYSTINQWLKKTSTPRKDKDQAQKSEVARSLPGNDAFAKLVHQFLMSLKSELDSIKAFIEHENWTECQKVIHNIKGRGGSFGFPQITEMATKLDALLKNGQNKDFSEQFDDFYQLCADIIKQHLH